MDQVIERFETLGADAALYAPRLLGALAFLLLGVVIAWLADRALQAICRRVQLDESSGGQRLQFLFSLAGFRTSPSAALRWLVRWTLIVVAVAQAARFLDLDVIANLIDRLVNIAPVFLVVLAVAFLGAALSERVSRAAHAAAERSGAIPPTLVAGTVRAAILAGALALALESAGVTADLPVVVLAICLAATLLLVIAALVIGARGLLENLLAARYVEEHYIEGQIVEFHSERAQIRSIGLLATVIRTNDGTDHTLPNAMFLRESI